MDKVTVAVKYNFTERQYHHDNKVRNNSVISLWTVALVTEFKLQDEHLEKVIHFLPITAQIIQLISWFFFWRRAVLDCSMLRTWNKNQTIETVPHTYQRGKQLESIIVLHWLCIMSRCHPSTSLSVYPLQGQRGLKPTPAVIGWEQG